jgi:hypothetical protein
MTVPKLACLEPVKLALKSALTKSNIWALSTGVKETGIWETRRKKCLPRSKQLKAISCVRNDTVTSRLEGVKKLTTARGCFWTGNAARLQA